MSDVELLVVGGGTAGIVAARTAVQLGADVLLIESDGTGGECLWTGCVPSKALLSAAGDDPMVKTSSNTQADTKPYPRPRARPLNASTEPALL